MVVHFYTKRPIIIKALQLEDNWDEVKDFVGGDVLDDPVQKDGEIGLRISTLEGKAVVHSGDWIIQGVEGEFYPCRADIFEETYARTCHLDEHSSDPTVEAPEWKDPEVTEVVRILERDFKWLTVKYPNFEAGFVLDMLMDAYGCHEVSLGELRSSGDGD